MAKGIVVSVRLESSLADAVISAAESRHLTMTQYLRSILAEKVGEPVPAHDWRFCVEVPENQPTLVSWGKNGIAAGG